MKTLYNVLEREDLTSTQKLLLITLESFSEVAEGISLYKIAFYTPLTRKTVIINLKVLEVMGLLEVVRDSTRQNKYITFTIFIICGDALILRFMKCTSEAL